MQGVRFVVKLYDLPSEEGTITAFDSFGPQLYIGTDKGSILKFIMEDPSAPSTATGGAGDTTARPKATTGSNEATSIYTTQVASINLSDPQKKRIARVQHSRQQPLLFALCFKKVHVINSTKMTVLTVIGDGVGCFYVSTLLAKAASSEDTSASVSTKQAGALSTPNTAANVEQAGAGTPLATPSGSSSAKQPSVVHMITTAEKHGRGVEVFELEASAPQFDTKVRQTQELVLPEPVEALVELNGMLCVGLRREYSMLCLKDGDARSILALSNRVPLIAMGDGEVFLRLQQNVFAVSMKVMPTAGQTVKRTMRFENEPQCILFRHPFLFAFMDSCCDVFCLYDDEVVERLPLPGVLFGSKYGTGDTIYAASGNKLWMIRIHSLRSQLAGLIQRYKVSDAFHLLSYQRRSSPQFAAIERDLNVMAGFAHLYHGHSSEAMHHFAGLVDVREVLRHVPELCPEFMRERLIAASEYEQCKSLISPEERERRNALLAQVRKEHQQAVQDGLARKESCWVTEDEEQAYEEGWYATCPFNRIGVRGVENVITWPKVSSSAQLPSSQSQSLLLSRKKAGKSIAVVGCTIEEIWKQCYSEFPEAAEPVSQPTKTFLRSVVSDRKIGNKDTRQTDVDAQVPSSIPMRVIPEMGGTISETDFLSACRHDLKRDLGCYAVSVMSTSDRDQRRAGEFAVLILALQSTNWAGAYEIIDQGSFLCLDDAYWLLFDAGEFRLLALLLTKRGLHNRARALFFERVSIESFILPKAKQDGMLTMGMQEQWHACMREYEARVVTPQIKRLQDAKRRWASTTRVSSSSSLPPSSWNEGLSGLFVAVDHMDATYVESILRRDPLSLYSVDTEGNSPAMVAVAYLENVPSPEPMLSMLALLIDSGCSLTHRNHQGEDLIDILKRVKGGSLTPLVLSYVSSLCSVQVQLKHFLEEELPPMKELRFMHGCDPTVCKQIGDWHGYVMNAESSGGAVGAADRERR